MGRNKISTTAPYSTLNRVGSTKDVLKQATSCGVAQQDVLQMATGHGITKPSEGMWWCTSSRGGVLEENLDIHLPSGRHMRSSATVDSTKDALQQEATSCGGAQQDVLRMATEQGLTKQSEGMWWCTSCGGSVPEVHLDAHLSSKRHTRSSENMRCVEELVDLARAGKLPEWMTVRDNNKFCTVCNAFATVGHLNTDRHAKRLEWYLSSHSVGDHQKMEPNSVQVTSGRTSILAEPLGSQEPPAHWGDARFFEFNAADGWWQCKLCQQWADEAHISGRKHSRRAAFPEQYIETLEGIGTSQTTSTSGTVSADVLEESVQHQVRTGDGRATTLWDEYVDPASGRRFYHHKDSGEISWTRPACLLTTTTLH